jgi:hypothetical protein
MRFIINGTAYEAASLERITGADAIALLRETGMGVQTLARRVLAFGDLGSPEEMLDDVDTLTAFLAFLWVSRRVAGERSLSFDEACQVEILSVRVELDADDELGEAELEPDPTPSPASAPGGDAGA